MTMIKGYCRVLYTILENIIGVCIVMKICVGRDAAGVETNSSFQYNIWTGTISFHIVFNTVQ